ncbi:DUF3857 domain-containing protein [Sphingomonas sp. Sphisp140]|uniref:DUF3857 domain-containing protein n=1 Tax=unclassified Sphingomonas TaxID=196159 RepID=UPI0039AE993E
MRIVLSSVALTLLTGTAHAGDKPLYQPAPAWVRPAPAPDAAKLTDADPATVLSDQQQRLSSGQVWAYNDQATRIVSPQMLTQFGTVQLPWQPEEGDLIVHKAEIIRAGEHIDLLAGGKGFEVLRREEQLEQLQINGTLTATMTVQGLRVGDVLRLSYSVTSHDKALGGNAQTFVPLVAAPERVGYARARVSWPSGTPLRWRSYADGAVPKVTKQGGFDEIEVTLPLPKPAELPADAPGRYQKPALLEVTSFTDWKSVSAVMGPLYATEGLIAPGSPLAAEVDKIKGRSADPRVRAALALRLVQDEIRYLFEGMNGGNYVPQKPADTWTRRYGDCKAKALLLLSLLRAMDIEAEPVAASMGMSGLVAQRLPSAGAFDHVLVHATIGGKPLWLDGTGSGTRLEDLDDTPPFRDVLPLRPGGAELIPLPMHAPARPMMETALEFDQRAGLSLPTPFTLTIKMRGQMAEMVRAMSSQASKEQLEDMGQGMVAGVIGDALVVERKLSYDSETATATATASGIVGSPWKLNERRYRAQLDRIVSAADFSPDRARPAWKDIPVVTTPVPFAAVMRTRIRLPGQGAGFTLDGDQTLPARFAGIGLTRKVTVANGEVVVEDSLASDAAEVAPADLPAVRAQVALAKSRLLEMLAPTDYPARWQIVANAGKTGFPAIMAVYAKGIADAAPDETLGYTNRASFLAGIWDWKGAAADYDKAITIEPTVPLYLARARMRQAMRDDKGARADVEAALALDPGSLAAINMLASLRFRAGERDAAMALIDERIAAGGKAKQGFVTKKADLLGEAGRAEEGVKLIDEEIRVTPGNEILLNSRCWLKGTSNILLDTALKDCTRAIEIAEDPSSIYDSRAMVYFRMGKMEEAMADLNAALEVSPMQGASLFLRGVVRRRTGDIKGSDTDLAAARLMWPRVDEDYARYGIKP